LAGEAALLARLLRRFQLAQFRHGGCRRILPIFVLVPPLGLGHVMVLCHGLSSRFLSVLGNIEIGIGEPETVLRGSGRFFHHNRFAAIPASGALFV
jgi:hypothetical protein